MGKKFSRLSDILSDYVQPLPTAEEKDGDDIADDPLDEPFAQYRSAWPGGVAVLMKAEHQTKQKPEEGEKDSKPKITKFFELDVKKSLRNNLKGKTVVEHPVVFVVLRSHQRSYFPLEVEAPEFMAKQQREEEDQRKRQESLAKAAAAEQATNRDDDLRQNEYDWSDFHQTVVPGEKGADNAQEEGEDKDYFGKSFGLFAAEGGEEDPDREEVTTAEKRKREEEEREESMRKRRHEESEEELRRVAKQRQRAWKGAASAHEDSSFVRAFAMQDDPDYGKGEKAETAKEGEGEEPSEENYQQYYDYYLKYYQRKYGLAQPATGSPQKEDSKDAGKEAKPPAKAEGGSKEKSAGGLALLGGYDDSDDE